jgi:hypothetical protein
VGLGDNGKPTMTEDIVRYAYGFYLNGISQAKEAKTPEVREKCHNISISR